MKASLAVSVVLGAVVLLAPPSALQAETPYWVEPMQQVHANFQGNRGTIARFGDSITYSGAFFKPLQNNFTNTSPEEQEALTWLRNYMVPSCWTWQDDAVAYGNGCYSGKTAAWPLQVELDPSDINIVYWLNKLQPELAVVMWGTNDLGPYDVATYTSNMRQVIQQCKAFGTIPLLTTIPPRAGYVDKSAQFAQAMRDLAIEQEVPLIDYHQEILARQPGTAWQGTLISSDGVHPSWSGATAQDFSESSLNTNGYLLRNWVTLHGIWDVYQQILQYDPPIRHHTVSVFDTAPGDVPGPQPIRVFPIPAAAGWPGGELLYDNYAEGLTFSPGPSPGYYNYVSLPLGNAAVAIHGVQNSPASPLVVNDTFQLYVTQEGSDADPRQDNRFPYHVPRLARSHSQNYLAVMFDLTEPARRFGVFLPASTNNWTDDPQHVNDDQNFLLQDRSVWVTIVDDSGDSHQQYVSLRGDAQGAYCPFLSIECDGTHAITQVSIIHDVGENTNRGVSVMDIYAIPFIVGDINGDGHVNAIDLLAMALSWSKSQGDPAYNPDCDLDHSGSVNAIDLLMFAHNWLK